MTGLLQDAGVTEASGIAASRLKNGIYWTHNDSGGKAVIYAFDSKGRSYGRWTVSGATNLDWEDIAIGPGPERGRPYIYIADTGDNSRKRDDVVIYRVPEPQVRDAACRAGCKTRAAATLRFRYSDGPHDAETLLVHPVTGDIYLVTKAAHGDSKTAVFVSRGGKDSTLKPIAALSIPDATYRMFAGGITGGDISPDGRSVALCDYLRLYRASLPASEAFDEIWKRPFPVTPTGAAVQVEGVCFRADGKGVVAISEGEPGTILEAR